ncbi:MAG: D-sedoheptulose-7-phosphate isomerase, partial [Gammaproteobacteria bacterium]
TTDTAALTAIGNDYGFERVFERQVHALWSSSLDVLLVLTTSGNSGNLLSAIYAAMSRNMTCVAMTGGDGGLVAQALSKGPHIEIRVRSRDTARIQEIQLVLLHCLCEAIENDDDPGR